MSARSIICFALPLYLMTVSFGAEPQDCPPPQKHSKSAREKSLNLRALNHLRLATEQLEAAGRTEEAGKLREVLNQLNRRVIRERAESSRKNSEQRKQSDQPQQLTGGPEKILCRCCFLELSSEAAKEFAAAAELVSSPADTHAPTTSVYKNAEEVIQRLKKAGRVKVIHGSPQIVTFPGQPAKSLIGGEFPILIPVGDDRTSVEWCQFGVSCEVVPRLLDTGRIELQFSPEISHPDYKNSVKVNGYTVPRLWVCNASTQAELNLGETLVVSLDSNEGSQGRALNAESDTAPLEKTVTLFMVTPVAADANAVVGAR